MFVFRNIFRACNPGGSGQGELVEMNVKFWFVLSSLPASEEIGSVGDRVSAGSGSGGPDHRSDLCHPHWQCARCWILSRHHCESPSLPVSHTSALMVFICCFLPQNLNIPRCVFVPPAKFWSISWHCWHPPGGKPKAYGESVPLTHMVSMYISFTKEE